MMHFGNGDKLNGNVDDVVAGVMLSHTNSVYHDSHNASVITCHPVPVSAKMYHIFKYSFT